jgi:hypothetical protein
MTQILDENLVEPSLRENAFDAYRIYMESETIDINLNRLESNQELNAQGTDLMFMIAKCYPPSGALFRYRIISDYSFSALKNDELWFSAARTYNDPFDSLCHIDMQKMSKSVLRILGIPDSMKLIDKISKCKEYENIFKDMGRSKKTACFSEDICSTLMWAHYAGQGSGFAVEYAIGDMTKALMGNGASFAPFPVIYSDKR